MVEEVRMVVKCGDCRQTVPTKYICTCYVCGGLFCDTCMPWWNSNRMGVCDHCYVEGMTRAERRLVSGLE